MRANGTNRPGPLVKARTVPRHNRKQPMPTASPADIPEERTLFDKLKGALVTPIRAMRLRYLPLLMIYYAYGALGLVAIAEAFWVKEALTFTPAELAAIAVWLTLPWTIKMVFGQLADFGADHGLATPGLCVHRRESGRLGHDHSCRRRRRLDRIRRQERALCHRPASDRDRRRAPGRDRRRHDHRGGGSRSARRHAEAESRDRPRAWPGASLGAAGAMVRHLVGGGAVGLARAILQL